MRKRLLRVACLSLGIGGALALLANPTFAALYDVDFGTPPHTVGLPPLTGAGPPPRDTVSGINFGTPTVVSGFGVLTDQPCEFNSFDDQGDQIQLDLDDLPPAATYSLDCDLTVADVTGNDDFAVIFDTPFVRTIRFNANGDIVASVPGVRTVVIGTYTLGTLIHLRVEIDLATDLWHIFINNVPAHSGSFGGSTELLAIRFSTSVLKHPPGVNAGLDNVVVDQMVPTPVEQSSWSAIKATFR